MPPPVSSHFNSLSRRSTRNPRAEQQLARQVAGELSIKLPAPICFDFANLHAFDIQGRAVAMQRMVAGGMELERAVALSGLLAGD